MADQLYQGDHWVSSQLALQSAQEAAFAAEYWVVSAGYGLYPAETPIASYAATFATGHEDSVTPDGLQSGERRDYLADWWRGLSERVEFPGVKHRTFLDLAARYGDARVLVISGGAYLDAIAQDLAAAGELWGDRLMVVSGGAKGAASKTLDAHLLPVDARLQHAVGGTRSALNARVAKWLLDQVSMPEKLDVTWARARLERELSRLPPAKTFNRDPMRDSQVRGWIRRNRKHFDRPSASAMLRSFRDAGLACEQKRFGRLFKEVTSRGRK